VASPNARVASIFTRWLPERDYWRVGVSALASAVDNDAEAKCWMSWRDIDPPRAKTDQIANGPVLESYFTVPAGNPTQCTGEAATYAQIPTTALAEGSTLGASWKTPVQLEVTPSVSVDGSDTEIVYPVTTFTQTPNGTTQTLTPVVSNPPAAARYSLQGDLPTYTDGSEALTFSTFTGEITSPGIWPQLFHAVDTNGDTTCAISKDRQELSCWGKGVGSPVPLDLSAISNASTALMEAVTVGVTDSSTFACVLFSDSRANCIGDGASGQLGGGLTPSASDLNTLSTQVLNPDGVGALTGIASLQAGYEYTCATMVDGSLYCWGDATPAGLASDSALPVQITGLPTVSSVAVGKDTNATTCAVTTTSRLLCWGSNLNGKAGVGSTSNTVPTPTLVVDFPQDCSWAANGGNGVTTCGPEYYGGPLSQPLSSVTSAATGPNYSCAVVRAGVKCWGNASSASLPGVTAPPGNGNVLTANQYVNGLSQASAVKKIALGANSACATLSNSSVQCWGSAAGGALGSGTTSGTASTPAPVITGFPAKKLSSIVGISGYGQNYCALDGQGRLWCYGTSTQGAMGPTTTSDVAFEPSLSGEISGLPADLRVSVLDSSGFPVASTGIKLDQP